MSCIFDALQRSESERSGVEYPAVTAEPTELLRAAERLQAAEAPQSTHGVEAKQSESLPRPCRSCGSPVPADKLFCPKCDSFQGSIATEECHDEESHAEPEHLVFPEPSASWIHALWAQKAPMPRWMVIALQVGLMLSVVLALTVHEERSVNPRGAIGLPDGTVASSVPKFQPKPGQRPVAPETGQSTQITRDREQGSRRTAPSSPTRQSEVGTPTGGLVHDAIVHRVLPDVPEKAGDTIQGTLMVSVRVTVDPSGSVVRATLDSPVPSKYFANLALQAARRWEFTPAQVDGRDVSSEWILRFGFQKTATKVLPVRAAP